MDSLQVLIKARALLAAGWCQHNFALDDHGRPVPTSRGSRFCMVGALHVANDTADGHALPECILHPVMTAVSRAWAGSGDIVGFNDNRDRTQAQVLEVMTAAIAIVEPDPVKRLMAQIENVPIEEEKTDEDRTDGGKTGVDEEPAGEPERNPAGGGDGGVREEPRTSEPSGAELKGGIVWLTKCPPDSGRRKREHCDDLATVL